MDKRPKHSGLKIKVWDNECPIYEDKGDFGKIEKGFKELKKKLQ